MTVSSSPPRTAANLTVLFDADCGFCWRAALLLHRLDRARTIRVVPLQRAASIVAGAPPVERLRETIHVVDAAGRWSTGGAAWVRILDDLPPLRPLAIIARTPMVRPFVEPVYGWVASHRGWLGRHVTASRTLTGRRATTCGRSASDEPAVRGGRNGRGA